jgi:hypothetical protein
VASQETDSRGRFRIERDFSGAPLLAGIYQVRVSAQEYEPGETALFPLAENEFEDLGDIPLMPFPIGFSQVSPCGNLAPDGGLCRFSVRITNRLGEPVDGAAWSLVQAFGIGSLTDSTLFQVGLVRRMTLAPGRSRVLQFGFEVPATVRDGTTGCVQIFFGEDRQRPFFNTVGRGDLFCIQKGLTGALRVLSEKESHRMLREIKKGTRPMRREK